MGTLIANNSALADGPGEGNLFDHAVTWTAVSIDSTDEASAPSPVYFYDVAGVPDPMVDIPIWRSVGPIELGSNLAAKYRELVNGLGYSITGPDTHIAVEVVDPAV